MAELSQPTRVHVIPNYPVEPEHEPDVGCWCEPERTYVHDNGGEVWTHRRLQ